jgi:ketosteroid isomerase-like protein
MPEVIDRLVKAVNGYDLEALVGCFADDYKNETPVHPLRGFTGNEQVRKNWSRILGSIKDIDARVLRTAEQGDLVWTEWDISGNRPDGGPFLMRGVVIFGVTDDIIRSACFYLEPAEDESGDVDRHTERVVTGQ